MEPSQYLYITIHFQILSVTDNALAVAKLWTAYDASHYQKYFSNPFTIHADWPIHHSHLRSFYWWNFHAKLSI